MYTGGAARALACRPASLLRFHTHACTLYPPPPLLMMLYTSAQAAWLDSPSGNCSLCSVLHPL